MLLLISWWHSSGYSDEGGWVADTLTNTLFNAWSQNVSALLVKIETFTKHVSMRSQWILTDPWAHKTLFPAAIFPIWKPATHASTGFRWPKNGCKLQWTSKEKKVTFKKKKRIIALVKSDSKNTNPLCKRECCSKRDNLAPKKLS